jgi:hypothetical protein
MNFNVFGIKATMTAAMVAGVMTIASMPAQAASIGGKNFSMEGSAILKNSGGNWLLDFLPDQYAASGDGRARVGSTSEIAEVPLGTEFYIKDLSLTQAGSNWSFVGNLPWFNVNGVAFTLEKFVMTSTSLGGYQASLEGVFQTANERFATDYGYFGSSKRLSSTFGLNGTTFQADLTAGTVPVGSTPVPTPALLPGLLGLGLTAMRKKRDAIA